MRRDPPPTCGWLLGQDRCCTNLAVVLVESKRRRIVACEFHRGKAGRWAGDGGAVTVTDLAEPSTLF